MAKKTPNHQHHRDDPAKHTSAPNKSGSSNAPARSGQGTQDHSDVHGTGQFGDAGDAPLMKK